MDKKKAHSMAGLKRKINFKDNSAKNQRAKVLEYLKNHRSITSNEAREKLDIYHPPARIKELRQAGYKINTVWESWISEYGINHRIARYVLVNSKPLAQALD